MTAHPPAPHGDASPVGHQPDVVSARGVAAVSGILAAVVVGALWFLWVLYGQLSHEGSPPSALPAAWRQTPPPPPESDQRKLLRALRAWEEQTLAEYAWQNADKTVARIPIEKAMQLFLQEQRTAAAPASSEPAPAAPAEPSPPKPAPLPTATEAPAATGPEGPSVPFREAPPRPPRVEPAAEPSSEENPNARESGVEGTAHE